MKLRLRPRRNNEESPSAPEPSASRSQRPAAELAYQALKLRVHRQLIERIDLANLARLDIATANAELKVVIRQLVDEQPVPLSQRDRLQLTEEVLNEVHGLGPIEPLMRDPEISDILVNSARQVYVERLGKLEATQVIFRDDAHLLQIIDRIVSRVGRRIDESSPMVDARLPDGSRVNAIIPPLALDGPSLSIRRFGMHRITVEDLVRLGSVPAQMVEVIHAMVLARLNILISGGTGSGKTTLLNCISSFIPEHERIVTIEDSAELSLQQPHVVRLETRPENVERRGEVTQRDLLRNSLRMRPDRIVIGEVRGAESLDMLQAMNTGHDGSISTIHANSARDSVNRLEMMMQMSGFDLPTRAMRQQISLALDVVIQTARFSDGTRKVTSICEVAGMEGETISMQELFTYQREGVDENGKIVGSFISTGIRPRFADSIKASSYAIDPAVFDYLSREREITMELVLLALIVFVAIVAAGSTLASWEQTRDDAGRVLEQRLDMAAGGPAKDRDAPAVLKDLRRSSIGLVDTLLARLPFVPAVERAIKQAGLRKRVGEILLYVPLLWCMAFLFVLVVGGSALIALVIATVLALTPLMMVYRRKRIRAQLFAEQLPDALDLIRAALQAGHGFATALAVVAAEFPDPIAEEFREVGEETRLGLSLREALNNLNQRIDDPDLPMLIIGVLITEDSGGNLAEVLDNIGHTVRERFKMSRDIRTMTAQGRLSGMVLTVLPFIVGTVTYFLNPTYFKPMVATSTGHYMLLYALVSIIIGHFMIQRIARIRV